MKEREERGGKLRGLGKSKESCKRKDSGKRKLTTNKQEREEDRREREREKCKEEEIVEGREKEDGEMKVRDEGSSEEQRKWCALPLLFVSCSSLFFFLSKRPSSPTVSLLPLLHCFYILLCDWGPKKQKPKGALYFG